MQVVILFFAVGLFVAACGSKPMSNESRQGSGNETESAPLLQQGFVAASNVTAAATVTPSEGACETLSKLDFQEELAAGGNVSIHMRINASSYGEEALLVLENGTALYRGPDPTKASVKEPPRYVRVTGALTTADAAALQGFAATVKAASLSKVPSPSSLKTPCEQVTGGYSTGNPNDVGYGFAKREPSACQLKYIGGDAGKTLVRVGDVLFLRARRCPSGS